MHNKIAFLAFLANTALGFAKFYYAGADGESVKLQGSIADNDEAQIIGACKRLCSGCPLAFGEDEDGYRRLTFRASIGAFDSQVRIVLSKD